MTAPTGRALASGRAVVRSPVPSAGCLEENLGVEVEPVRGSSAPWQVVPG
jgi:hypothetical protein